MTAEPQIRVLLVDDHPVVRDGLRGILADEPGISVVGEAGNGDEALALVDRLHPDLLLLDLRMPALDGVGTIKALAARNSPSKVLVLTTYDTDDLVVAAIEAGATGYLLKDAPRDDLIRAVRASVRGEAVLSPAVASRLMGRVRQPADETLSARELEVLRLVAQGNANREVASRLFISEATVKTHLLHIYAKLGVSDRAAAVAVAYERGHLRGSGAAT